MIATLQNAGTYPRSALPRLVALACLVFVFGIGVSSINSFPVSYDEIESLKHIRTRWLEYTFSIPETLHSVSTKSVEHGPLYFVILNLWYRLAGYDLFASRLLSVFFAILTVALVFRLGRLTGKRDVGAAAAVAIAGLAYFNYYAQETRMYALLLLLVAWLLLAYWRTLHARGRVGWRGWLSLFLPAAMIMNVNYFGFVILCALGFYHLLLARKDWRWLQISLVMAAAGFFFLGWLDVALRGFQRSQDALDPSRLPPPESLFAMLSIYANGLWILPLASAALCLRWKRNRAECYLLFMAGAALLLLYAMNEATTIMVARRMRYTIVLAIPFACFLAIGLTRLPRWDLLRYPLLALWIAAGVAYFNSEQMLVYTNRREINQDQVPHYQEFIYARERLPLDDQLIVSVHRDTLVKDYDTLIFYAARLPQTAGIQHIGYNPDGELQFEGEITSDAAQEILVEKHESFWLLRNPQQTEMDDLGFYRDWLSQHYRSCGDWISKPQAVIAFYLKHDIPCSLVNDAQPIAVDYEGGARLGNVEIEERAETVNVYLWWHATIEKRYSYTLQLFDQSGQKWRQVDALIRSSPIDSSRIDLAGLPPGDYQLQLIVYDFKTLKSQGGVVVADGRRIERALLLDTITIAKS